MQRVPSESVVDAGASLQGWACRPESIGTIREERLLPPGLVRRLETLYPQHSRLRPEAAPLFTGKENFSGLAGFREVCSILREHGIEIGFEEERELFVDVYRFLATRHILNLIDWESCTSDPIFHLVMPQPNMIRSEVVEAYSRATTREERRGIAAAYMRETNPHDGHQQLNKPWFTTRQGDVALLHGSQHKYPQCQLIFDKQTQHCFAFCTYCFRHAQVRGDEDMFVQEDVEEVHDYLRLHREVNDLLITGGDAGFLTAERFERYVTPLLEDPALIHVKTVRLGSRALTYQPELVLSPAYDGMLELLDRLYANGIQAAWMAHFSTPRELLNPLTIAAIRRLQAHHVVLRSQSPMMQHISLFADEHGRIDIEQSAQNWIDLANILGMLNVGFHSLYAARPTGEHHYFSAPLAEMHKVFDRIYRSLPSINRPSRHLSMTTSAGKISILGTAQVHGETVFALKFTEGRNMEWLDRVFLAKYDQRTDNVALLEPYDSDEFFFEAELREIEQDLSTALAELAS
jgi:L-lysine 2,3-aminomutase